MPEEVVQKITRAEALEANKRSALDFEDESGFDLEFIGAFKKDIFEKRRDYFKGQPHWFLVRSFFSSLFFFCSI